LSGGTTDAGFLGAVTAAAPGAFGVTAALGGGAAVMISVLA
jgi:hypothetical protein